MNIGELINLIDVRNNDLSVQNLIGVTTKKKYIPSVANTIGTDLSNYKVISYGQFACSLMQVSRDGAMPIAMYRGEKAIMSPAYPIFEVKDKDIVLPEYLDMYFSREEFDREAVFLAVGGVRGSLDWDDFCSMKVPVPSIDTQRKIVAQYQTIEKRIQDNERTIALLEDTVKTIYRKMFVDGIDQNNLPDGWRMGTFKDLCCLKSGYAFKSEWWTKKSETTCSVVKIGNITSNNSLDLSDLSYVEEINTKKCEDFKILPFDILIAMTGATAGKSCLAPLSIQRSYVNQRVGKFFVDKRFNLYVYLSLNNSEFTKKISDLGQGSAQGNFSGSDIENLQLIVPTDAVIDEFNITVTSLIQYRMLLQEELVALSNLKNLICLNLS